jgi:hypothetical protein
MLKGGCLCGAVRFEVEGEPLFSGFCHCRDCLKATSAGHAPFMGFMRSNFRLQGETRMFGKLSDQGIPTNRHFCPACGSMVYGDGAREPGVDDMVTLYAGSLDDPTAFTPQMAIFTRHRPQWAAPVDPVQEYSTMPGEGPK